MYDAPPTQREYVNMQYSLLESLREFDPDIVVYMYKIENKLHDIATVSTERYTPTLDIVVRNICV
jgi:hypothetical protein